MITQEAIKLFRDYLRLNHRKRTIESYGPLLEKYEAAYADTKFWILLAQMKFTTFWKRLRSTYQSPRGGSGMHR